MAYCKIGHVYIINTLLTKPPKAKFAICVCVDPELFIWINSNPRPHGHDQMPLVAGCHSLVKHDSFLDLSRVVAHQSIELEDAREFECISRALRDEIIRTIEAGLEVLPPRHETAIKANLRALFDD